MTPKTSSIEDRRTTMGRATEVSKNLILQPLSTSELEERTKGAVSRTNITATPDGYVVERVTPQAAPKPITRREEGTWD
jgi:hypothetical protein